jgi:hypothetical protein
MNMNSLYDLYLFSGPGEHFKQECVNGQHHTAPWSKSDNLWNQAPIKRLEPFLLLYLIYACEGPRNAAL